MSSELAHLPQQFREKLVDQVLQSFMGMLPKEKVDEMIEKEVMAFFETEQILTISETKLEITNPMYDPKDRWSEPNKKVDALVFGAKMTPFRQLVWSCMHQHLTPIVKEAIDASVEKHREALTDWMNDTFTKPVEAGAQVSVGSQLNHAATMMMASVYDAALRSAHENMRMAFQAVGADQARIANMPVPFYSPTR